MSAHEAPKKPPRRGQSENLTPFDSARGTAAITKRWEKERERRADLERQAAQLFVDELLSSIRTYVDLRDDADAPEAVRLQAADRIVERMLGKVGQRLEVTGRTETEVTFTHDADHAARILEILAGAGVVAAGASSGNGAAADEVHSARS